MIELVMNAFPRTGSTILWRMVKEARPDALHLYEPLHDKLFILLDNEGDKSSVLHGVPLWEDYFKVDQKTVHEMRLKHCDCTNLLRLQDIQRYLDVVDAIPERLILQPNRMHFILKDLAQRYDCKVLHLTRGPADCFLGFVEIFEMFGSALTKDYHLCGYTSGCAIYEKEKDYHESTKYRKHEGEVSGWTNELLKDEHRTSNVQHRMLNGGEKTYDLEERLLIIAGDGISVYFSLQPLTKWLTYRNSR